MSAFAIIGCFTLALGVMVGFAGVACLISWAWSKFADDRLECSNDQLGWAFGLAAIATSALTIVLSLWAIGGGV